jgi:hypothetical protein
MGALVMGRMGSGLGSRMGFWRAREVSAPRCQKRVKSITKRPAWARRNIGQTRGWASMCMAVRAVRTTAVAPRRVRKRKVSQARAKL